MEERPRETWANRISVLEQRLTMGAINSPQRKERSKLRSLNMARSINGEEQFFSRIRKRIKNRMTNRSMRKLNGDIHEKRDPPKLHQATRDPRQSNMRRQPRRSREELLALVLVSVYPIQMRIMADSKIGMKRKNIKNGPNRSVMMPPKRIPERRETPVRAPKIPK